MVRKKCQPEEVVMTREEGVQARRRERKETCTRKTVKCNFSVNKMQYSRRQSVNFSPSLWEGNYAT
jgi:hypothetical protein